MPITFRQSIIWLAIILFVVSGCNRLSPTIVVTSTPVATATETPFKPSYITYSINETVPAKLRNEISNTSLSFVKNGTGQLQFGVVTKGQAVSWYYALVAPFPTVLDDLSSKELKAAWQGTPGATIGSTHILLSQSTQKTLTSIWGAPTGDVFQVEDDDKILTSAWKLPYSFAIIPIEQLNTEWKIITVDGKNLFDRHNDIGTYPLQVGFGWTGDKNILSDLAAKAPDSLKLPETNFNPQKMTILLMTGTTALVRSTAQRMEDKGLLYPDGDIKATLENADFTHTSNEISFYENCPAPNPNIINLQFCSNPKYLALLNDVDMDIVELTGNHLTDFGFPALKYTMDLYRQNGIKFFGSGNNLNQARQPLRLDHNGNKIALLGCDDQKMEHPFFATENSMGVAECGDFSWITQEVSLLKNTGYTVILTMQAVESYADTPPPNVKPRFEKAAESGPDFLFGSQAHVPQGFELVNNTLIHFGSGNLFFDQMDDPNKGTRREVYDRLIIYDNHLVSIELLTGLLMDYSRPRLMNPDERITLLSDLFKVSFWNK